MGYLGKMIGGVAGFAMGGPIGAMLGAALGHKADGGRFPSVRLPSAGSFGFSPARVAALIGGRDQLFAIGVVVLSAKLAKCDGPVNREEIAAFKAHFRIPPEAVRDIGRLFDQARDSADGFAAYADELGQAFADNRGTLEDVLTALFGIARSDGPATARELAFLQRVRTGFGLDEAAWDRARGASARTGGSNEPDPYAVLGVPRTATSEELRAAWKALMRANHPDSLASRGVPAEFIARAGAKVAQINAAWDRIKRERGL